MFCCSWRLMEWKTLQVSRDVTKCFQMFDRILCVRQLRYSGMMETIRIRRAGYPIRHMFAEFVDRYRILSSGIGPSHKENCRTASEKICRAVLGNADFQLGKTKVFLKVGCSWLTAICSCRWHLCFVLFLTRLWSFLIFFQDAQDAYMEQERDRVMTKKITVIQKAIRGFYQRQKFRKMRSSCVVLQKHVRAYQEKKRYDQVGLCLLPGWEGIWMKAIRSSICSPVQETNHQVLSFDYQFDIGHFKIMVWQWVFENRIPETLALCV